MTARAWTPEIRIVSLSFLVLYLELALIRWVAGYVHNFGYFTNFAMLAAFLGIGLGCLLAKRAALIAWLPWALLALAAIVRLANLQIDLPSTSPVAAFWSESFRPEGKTSVALGVSVLFVLITLVFVGLGQLLGTLFGELPRLRAYGLNVLGGLAGILVFAINSRFEHSPLVWFSIAAVIAAPFLTTTRKRWWPVHALGLVMFLVAVGAGTKNELWSPYYRQTLLKAPNGYMLAGNGIPGINMAEFDQLIDTRMYEVPFGEGLRALKKDPRAPIHRELVIGCGGGNDVAMGLQNGVERIDAVDINPWVIAMGRKHHPLKPFASDKVTAYVADGREFLARGDEKYDLIVYGLPDSTFTNDRANLRVESFIFTEEAFRKVLSRLSENGVFVVYNYYRVPWLQKKIEGMLRDASGQDPYVKIFELQAFPAAMAVGPGLLLPAATPHASPPPATDDWPFLYLVGATIPGVYVSAVAVAALASLLLVFGAMWWTRDDESASDAKRGGARTEPESPLILATLFLMGVAFVLLETRSVVTFGLFFGSTWWNNVVVFAAIHVSILLAVLVNTYFPSLPRVAMVAALIGSLVFAWALPPETLLVGSAWTRAVLAGTVAFSPIFCANVLFASIFRSTREGRVSYAFNLLGGMLGGLLEYVSLLVGYRALIGFALAVYLVALLLAYRYSLRSGAAAADRAKAT